METILFGKYRLISLLGQGTTSRVYLAEHTKLKVFRAIKCIPKTHQTQPQFLLETEILKNLKHPGIPTIYDIEEDIQSYYIIEEYIQGQSLKAFTLCQDCISLELMIHIMLQVCQVLQYLHRQKPNPVIYQDLKPDHIILCGSRVVLVDFGIAAYLCRDGNTFQQFGTRGYAPPEKYQGKSCDVRTDIYAFGKVLEFMAEKLSPIEYPILQPIIQRAAASSMEERFPSADAVIEVLQECMNKGVQKQIPVQKSKHLLNKIAIAGTQERVGTTHIGISLCCYFNENKRPCIYQESHPSESMRALVREDGVYCRPDGSILRGTFQGIPYYGEGIEKQQWQVSYLLEDLGADYREYVETEEKLILVAGSRLWERDWVRSVLDHIFMRENLVILCNYGDLKQAKELAGRYRHRVYCFPLDLDPFRMTREKRNLFSRLLKEEGW